MHKKLRGIILCSVVEYFYMKVETFPYKSCIMLVDCHMKRKYSFVALFVLVFVSSNYHYTYHHLLECLYILPQYQWYVLYILL